jgi:hypothetical protein
MDNRGVGYFVWKPDHSCWTCEHWSGFVSGSTDTAVCSYPGEVRVRAGATYGCVYWVRAVGLDDLTDEACAELVRRFNPEFPYPTK